MGEGINTISHGSRERGTNSLGQTILNVNNLPYVSDLKGKRLALVEPKKGLKPSDEGYHQMDVRILGVGGRPGYYRFDIREEKFGHVENSTKVYNTQESQKYLSELTKKYKGVKVKKWY